VADRSVLLVLIVRDVGLRSTLVARLSLAGGDLITASQPHDPVLERKRLRDAVMVIDEETIAIQPAGWIETVLDDPRWRAIVVLTWQPAASDAGTNRPRLIHVERDNAAKAITALVHQWRDEPVGG
jgi:hypothetical protein